MAFVLWFTGLSGSGKSTLAKEICKRLENRNLAVEHLDGDLIRQLFPQTGFDRDSRNDHIRRMGFLSSKLEKHGVYVVASFISPYNESRLFARRLCQNFIEIYLNTPLAICEDRDPKGLYRKVRQGTVSQFTGVHDPYEPPRNPELTLDTSKFSIDESIEYIIEILKEKNLFQQAQPKKLDRVTHGNKRYHFDI